VKAPEIIDHEKGTIVGSAPPSALHASAYAPFIFADMAGTWGVDSGIVGLSFEAVRHTSVGEKVITDSVTVLHLRMSLKGMRQLRDVLNQLDLVAAKQEGAAN
jgi:hypothetical protein